VIEEVARQADATLVLEPTAHGAVKTARKGSGIFKVTATGVEAHAGLAPQNGASAITALSEFVLAAAAVAAPDRGTTVNTGRITGGSATNVVAGRATAHIDIRVRDESEQARVDAEFAAIEVSDPRVRIEVDHAWNRPPMTLNAASAPLLELAREVAREQGRADLPDAAVGGASDANFVAALGLPVLCGMGAVGDGAHARGEFIHPDAVPTQTALVAGLLTRLANPLRG
jgi:glutamate carboxypeptidase